MKTQVPFRRTSSVFWTTVKSKKGLLTCSLNSTLFLKVSTLCSLIHQPLVMPWTLGSCCPQVLSFAMNSKLRWIVEWDKPSLIITSLPRCWRTKPGVAFPATWKKTLWITWKTLMSPSQESWLLTKSKIHRSSQLQRSLTASRISSIRSSIGSMWCKTQNWSQSSVFVVLQFESFLAHHLPQVLDIHIAQYSFYQWYNFVYQGIILSFVGLERTFSSFGLIHTKLRNRLGNERVMKLVRTYCHLRDRNKEGLDNFDAVETHHESSVW